MHRIAYKIILSTCKRIRGVPLEDLPDNWTVILKSFDESQRLYKEAPRIAEQLLNETYGFLNMIGEIAGKDTPSYIAASNIIAHSVIEILTPVIEKNCIRANLLDLKIFNRMELHNSICEIQIVLQQVLKLDLIDETVKRIEELYNKLSLAESKVNLFPVS